MVRLKLALGGEVEDGVVGGDWGGNAGGVAGDAIGDDEVREVEVFGEGAGAEEEFVDDGVLERGDEVEAA